MNIGLIAHDSKKKLMQNFCIAYKGILNKPSCCTCSKKLILIKNTLNAEFLYSI